MLQLKTIQPNISFKNTKSWSGKGIALTKLSIWLKKSLTLSWKTKKMKLECFVVQL